MHINGHCAHVLNWFFPYGDSIIIENFPRSISIQYDGAPSISIPVTTDEMAMYASIQAEYHEDIQRQMVADEFSAIYRQ